jgi:hypothetical protein
MEERLARLTLDTRVGYLYDDFLINHSEEGTTDPHNDCNF